MDLDSSNVEEVAKKLTNPLTFSFEPVKDGYDEIVAKGKSHYEEDKKMKYLVEALDTYEKQNITDSELKRIPKAGEQFEVDKDRLEVLLGDNEHNTVFVKLIKKLDEDKNGTSCFTFKVDDVNEYQEGAIEKVTEELSLKEKNKPSTKKVSKKK